jgi:hypothetical protein
MDPVTQLLSSSDEMADNKGRLDFLKNYTRVIDVVNDSRSILIQ